MARKRKNLGKDAYCSCLGRFLHPSLHVRDKFPNMNKTKRFTSLRALRLEQRKVRNEDVECVIMTSNEFLDDVGEFIEMYCAKRYVMVNVEGPSLYYFAPNVRINNNITANDDDIEVPVDDQIIEFLNRTSTFHADEEDVQQLQGTVEIDDDNLPAPENIPTPLVNDNACIYDTNWGHSGICSRKMNGATDTKPTLNFPTSYSPTLVDLFDLLFPKAHVENVILKQTNKELKLGPLSYGEFLRWIGLWLLMSTIQGPERHDFWKTNDIDVHDGAPFRLNNLMSRNRFDEILAALTLTDIPPPQYKDRFHYVRQLIDAWNKNINENFKAGWATCLDESMSTWTNQFTCPGFMFVPRKPWPFGNEYHSICCGLSGIMFGVELVEGKDAPKERPFKFEDLGKTVSLLLRLTEPLWGTAKMVVLDSGFCVLKGIIELKKRGVYAAALIKKRRYWPKYIKGDEIKQHFNNKQVGDVDAIRGVFDEQPFHVYGMKEPEYIMLMMTTYGTCERYGKITKRNVNNDEVITFQYPEVIANHFKYRHIVDDHNAKRHAPISIEVVWATKQWEKRVFTFLLAVTEVNVMLAAVYFYNKKQPSMIQFRKDFSKELIYNDLIMKQQEVEEKRVTRSALKDIHELIKIPKKKNLKVVD